MKKLLSALLACLLALNCFAVCANATPPVATELAVEWNGEYSLSWTLAPELNLSDLTVTAHFDDGTMKVLPHWRERVGNEDYWTYSFDRQTNIMRFLFNGKERLASIVFPEGYILAYIDKQQPLQALVLGEATAIGTYQIFSFTAPESRDYRIESKSYATLSLAIVDSEGGIVQSGVFGWRGQMEEGKTYYIIVRDDDNREESFTISAVPLPTRLERFLSTPFMQKIYGVTLAPFESAFNATLLLVGMSFGMFIPVSPIIFLVTLVMRYYYGFVGLFS